MDCPAKDLEPGDRFPVGGIVRTVTSVIDHGDGKVTVNYTPGMGLINVSADLRLRHVLPIG